MNVTPLKPKTVDQSGARVIPNVAIETSLLVQKFKDRPQGFEADYGQISEWIGRNILTHRSYLTGARRILLREHDIILETVRGVGVRVCTNSGKLRAGKRVVTSVSRALGRAGRIFNTVEYTALPEDEKHDFNAYTSILGGLKLLSAPGAVKKILHEGASETLPSARVLEMLQK